MFSSNKKGLSVATIALNKETFASTIESNDIVLIDFWADWCMPCKRFAPIYEEASERHGDVVFAKVDTQDQQELAGALEIMAIPTVMGFRSGILVFRQDGMLSGAQLDDVVTQIQGLDMEQVKAEIERQREGGDA